MSDMDENDDQNILEIRCEGCNKHLFRQRGYATTLAAGTAAMSVATVGDILESPVTSATEFLTGNVETGDAAKMVDEKFDEVWENYKFHKHEESGNIYCTDCHPDH